MPKKIKKMEIFTTVRQQRKSVLYKNSKQAYKIFKDMVDYEDYELKNQEHFWIMGIDAIGYVVCVYIGAIGADNRAIIDPVDLFSTALAHKSKKVIIAHNHPSETKIINPSGNDFDLTNRLYHACLPFGIEIIDHIIFADKVFYSYIENAEMKLIHKALKYKSYDVLKPKLDEEKANAVKVAKVDALKKGRKEGIVAGKMLGLVEGELVGFDKGEVAGKQEEKIDMAKKMLADNEDIAKIVKYTGLAIDEINAIGTQSED